MKILLWDIDGTLILSKGAGQEALYQALKEEFGCTKDITVPIHGRTDCGIMAELFALHGIEHTAAQLAKFQRRYLTLLRQKMDERNGEVLPAVMDLIPRLAREKKVSNGLLTGNIREGAEIKLSRYGLMHYFPFGGYGDLHPDRSDVAREAHQAANHFHGREIEPDDIWVIGDTAGDVRCARAIGANVVGVLTGAGVQDELIASKPDILLKDLTEADSWLAHVLS